MLKRIVVVGLVAMLFSTSAFADSGPTGIKNIHIGMNKAEYILALKVNPINCSTYIGKDGKRRTNTEGLDPDEITACSSYFGPAYDKKGVVDKIQYENLFIEVVDISREATPFFENVGSKSTALFFKDRLVYLLIEAPQVSVDMLTMKYGQPKLIDNTKVKVCQNGIGNTFNNRVGFFENEWSNNGIKAIFTVKFLGPFRTCTDGGTVKSYLLQEPKIVNALGAVIQEGQSKLKSKLKQKALEENPF